MAAVNEGPSDQLPAIALTNYRLVSVLGQGGMGTVYLAEQQNPKRKVAVKIVAPNDEVPRAFLDALKNEGDIAARFEHDNLAHVYECGIVDDHYYLAMQYLAGGDLEQRLVAGMSLNEVRSVIRAIASALHTIHAQGYVHRDIKPGNILFTEAGKPVLADFGIAKAADSVGVLTSAGYSTGTPAYMSPEQIRGDALDGRSDLYSLGIVLYQCLSGELPFASDSDYELKEKQVRETPPPLTGVLARFQPVVDRLLAKNPDDRYPDAAKLIEALDALGTVSGMATRREVTGEATPVRPPESTPSPVTAWFREMTGRRVFRVLALYVAVAWGLTEIVTGVGERLGFPDWIATGVTVAFVVGFPIVLFLAWAFDIGPAGVRRVPTRRTGMMVLSLALAVLVSGTFLVMLYLPEPAQEAEPPRVTATAQEPDVTLAVMPFSNLSADQSLEYMGRAVAEELLNGMAVVSGLRLKGTASSFSLAGAEPATIATRLGVNRVVTGTFQQDGNSIRISARLLDAPSGDLLWSEVFSDTATNILALQDRIAQALAAGMGLGHPGQADTHRTVDPEAYRLYVQAREKYVNPFTDGPATIARLDEVLELDPDLPQALALRGYLDIGRAWVMEDRDSPFMKTGQSFLLKALDLDPNLPEAYASLALSYALQYRWKEARQMADRAVAEAAGRPTGLIYALAYNNLGHRSKSTAIAQANFERDPLDPAAMRHMLVNYEAVADDESVFQIKALLDEQGIPYNRYYLVWPYARAGERDKAAEMLRDTLEFFGLDPGLSRRFVDVYLDGGTDPELLAAIEQAFEAGTLPLANRIWFSAYAGASNDQLFEWANQALEQGKLNQIMFYDSGTAHLRQDERFLALMSKMGLVDYWTSVELPDFCRDESVAGICP